MENKRRKAGISLITLIITIVVVIILAAAVILSLAGNNPINNARIANLDQTKDGIESSILAYTGKIQSKTLGYYTNSEIITGGRSETAAYGIIGDDTTTTKNGVEIYNIDKDKFKNNVDKLPSTPNSKSNWYVDEDGKVYLVFDKKEDLPKWATDKNGDIDDTFLNKFIEIKDDGSPKITAKDVSENPNEYYGKKVTNYSANGVYDWKIFHSDGENIYLISSDYIPVDKIPATKGGNALVNTWPNCPKSVPLTPAINDTNYSNGSASISSSNPARKWLKSFLDNYSSTWENMKAVAYMLDIDVWNVYKTDKAEYAIGGPTVEMLMASYSKKNNVDYQAKAVGSNGYQISKDGGVNWAYHYDDMLSTSDSLYVIRSTSNAGVMWLASPSNASSKYVMYVVCNGRVDAYTYSYNSAGFRPVVCLKSDTKLKLDGDDYAIVGGPEHLITAEEINENPNKYYGKAVTNYNTNTSEKYEWQIFHSDKNNIYLITKDFINYADMPAGKKGTKLGKVDEYQGEYSKILNDYAGTSDIKDETIRKLNNEYLNVEKFETNYNNSKIVAYMLDTDVWNKKFKSGKADYAIGGPSIELLFASYNNKYKTNYALKAWEDGYELSNDGGNDWNSGYERMLDKNDSLYVKTNGAYDIASPSCRDERLNLFVNSTGDIGSSYGGGVSWTATFSLRPIVCLNSSVELESDGFGGYKIK